MKKRLFLSLILSLSISSIYTMEKPLAKIASQLVSNQQQNTVKADDECFMCFEEAQTIEQEQGADAVQITDCCKHFI